MELAPSLLLLAPPYGYLNCTFDKAYTHISLPRGMVQMRMLLLMVLIDLLQALVPESRLPTLAGSRVPMKYFDARPMRYVQIFGRRDASRKREESGMYQ